MASPYEEYPITCRTVKDDLISRPYLVSDMYAHRCNFENKKDFERALDVIVHTRAILTERNLTRGSACGDEYEDCGLNSYKNKALHEICERNFLKSESYEKEKSDEQPVS